MYLITLLISNSLPFTVTLFVTKSSACKSSLITKLLVVPYTFVPSNVYQYGLTVKVLLNTAFGIPVIECVTKYFESVVPNTWLASDRIFPSATIEEYAVCSVKLKFVSAASFTSTSNPTEAKFTVSIEVIKRISVVLLALVVFALNCFFTVKTFSFTNFG